MKDSAGIKRWNGCVNHWITISETQIGPPNQIHLKYKSHAKNETQKNSNSAKSMHIIDQLRTS